MALTEDEAAVYDRQLRVWGVETQRKCVLRVCCAASALTRTPQAHVRACDGAEDRKAATPGCVVLPVPG